MTTLLVLLTSSAVSCWLLTPWIARLAVYYGVVDRPDGHRKLHVYSTPLGGGLAVFISLVLATGLAYLAPDPWPSVLRQEIKHLGSLLAAALLLVIVGLVDDRYQLRGRHKLLGQLIAALILVSSGWVIRGFTLFEVQVDLGLLAVPFTLFWLLGAINSLNLIDGIDGLATTVGLVLSLTVATMALLTDHGDVQIVAMALAGSLLGFLWYNFPPAKIFLGDAGSMLIGLLIGALAMKGSFKGVATAALAAPLAVWAIPIFDCGAAIIRRKLTGRSVYTTDRNHLHHRLAARLGSNLWALGLIGLCCLGTCAGALLSVHMQSDLIALVVALSIVAILVATRLFGHVELLLLASQAKSLARSLVRFNPSGNLTYEATVRLQGSQQWELLWESLTEFADKLNLRRIQLNVNQPASQEGYHASWERPCKSDQQHLWHTEIPLFASGRLIGRLLVTGEPNGASSCQLIESLMDLLQPMEARFSELAVAGKGPPRAAIDDTVIQTFAIAPLDAEGFDVTPAT
jgi:UDP-GlcNAc:undecaprenyl-phosphate GlcNAc-1-phosphate transferase